MRVDLIYPNVREGYYEIDDEGNVYVKSTGCIRKTRVSRNGYIVLTCVGITRKYTTVLLHRAIGYAFLGLTDDLEINHINGIVDDNRLCNLEVVTHQQNIDHSIEFDLAPKGENHKNSIYTDEFVHQICAYLEEGFNNIETFERLQNVEYDLNNPEHVKLVKFIGRVRRGDRWQHISSQYNIQKKVYGTDMHRNK